MTSQEVAVVVPQVERIEKLVSLEAGRYWRATKSYEGFKESQVVLLKNVRYVDGTPHTVEVLCHPDEVCSGRSVFAATLILVDIFIAHFEYEPDGEVIRQQEIAALNRHIQKLQTNLQDIHSDPGKMDALVLERLRKNSPDLNLVDPRQLAIPELTTLSADAVVVLQQSANQLAEQAKAKAAILSERTEEISHCIRKLSPYFEEMAQAALAKTSEEQKVVERLRSGIQSLDLYIGKGVTVEQIAEGEPAAYDEPLTILQRKLMMDEEMCLFADVNDHIDSSDLKVFDRMLRDHEALAGQIFTTKRAVCVMATTRRYINYSEDARYNAFRNEDNRVVCLLVRNGGNIYRVYSPVESHLGANRLFPSKDDQENIFRGVRGDAITYDDVRFTDSLDRHEAFALHYKRFLLLLTGLDHREQLFGDFYPRSLNFMSMQFQSEYMRFVHDDDGTSMLSDGHEERASSFIARNNRYVTAGRGGSRVICDFERLVTEESAPGAYSKGGYDRNKYVLFSPLKRFSVLPVKEQNGRFYVEALMQRINGNGPWRWEEKRRQTRTVKVFLMDEKGRFYSDSAYPAFLHFDLARLEEVQRHLNDRRERVHHMEYIRFFKRVEALLLERERSYAVIRDKVFSIKPLTKTNEALLFELFVAYQAANDFIIPAEAEVNTVAAQLAAQVECHVSDGYFEKIKAFVSRKEVGLVHHVATLGDGRIVVYADPLETEKDERLGGFPWLHRLVLIDSKRGFRVLGKDWANAPVKNIREVYCQRAELEPVSLTVANVYNEVPFQFKSPEHKNNVYNTLTRFFHPLGAESRENALERYFEVRREASTGSVASVHAAYPAALMKEGDRLFLLFLVLHDPAAFFYARTENEGERLQILKEFVKIYRYGSKMRQNFLDQYTHWATTFSLQMVPVAAVPDRYFADPRARLPLFITEPKSSWQIVSSYDVLKGDVSIDAELTNYIQRKHLAGAGTEFFWATYEDTQLSPYRNEGSLSFDDVFWGKRVEYQRIPLYLYQARKEAPNRYYSLDFYCRDKDYFRTLTRDVGNVLDKTRRDQAEVWHGFDQRCLHCRYKVDRSGEVSPEDKPFGCSRDVKRNKGEGTIEELFSLEEIKEFASGKKNCYYHETISDS